MTAISEQNVTATELGTILNVTARRVRQLSEEDVFERVGRGRYPLVASVQSYIATIEARGDGEELRKERIAIMRAQRQRIEIENASRHVTKSAFDLQDAALSLFAHNLFLRLRPLGHWLHHELVNRGYGNDAVAIAGTCMNWFVGARFEIETDMRAALADSRRRGQLISDWRHVAKFNREPVGDDIPPAAPDDASDGDKA